MSYLYQSSERLIFQYLTINYGVMISDAAITDVMSHGNPDYWADRTRIVAVISKARKLLPPESGRIVRIRGEGYMFRSSNALCKST